MLPSVSVEVVRIALCRGLKPIHPARICKKFQDERSERGKEKRSRLQEELNPCKFDKKSQHIAGSYKIQFPRACIMFYKNLSFQVQICHRYSFATLRYVFAAFPAEI